MHLNCAVLTCMLALNRASVYAKEVITDLQIVQLPGSPNVGYLTEVGIGQQTFNLLINTGISDTLVNSAEHCRIYPYKNTCGSFSSLNYGEIKRNCGSKAGYEPTVPKDAKTGTLCLNNRMWADYKMTKDTFTFKGLSWGGKAQELTVKDQYFGVIENMSENAFGWGEDQIASGMLGLGPSNARSSMIEFAVGQKGKTVLENVIKSAGMKDMFGLCFSSGTGIHAGKLTLGDGSMEGMSYVPYTTNPQSGAPRAHSGYYLTVPGMFVGGSYIGGTDGIPARVDSAFYGIALPAAFMLQLTINVCATLSKIMTLPRGFQDPCWSPTKNVVDYNIPQQVLLTKKQVESLPPIILQLLGTQVKIQPTEYYQPLDVMTWDGELYYSLMVSIGTDQIILGSVFMKNKAFHFNRAEQMMGIMEVKNC